MNRTAIAAAALFAVAVLHATEAAAYVQARTPKSGVPVRWVGTNCIKLRPNSAGSADVTDGSDLLAVQRAILNWHQAIQGCAYMRFQLLEAAPDALPTVQRNADGTMISRADGQGVVVWIESGWRRDEFHDLAATALTVIFFIDSPGSERDGWITEADIELNGENFLFSTGGEANRVDIENTLAHELGHVLGLDHLCDDGKRPSPVDHLGNPLPACRLAAALPADVRAATMFNSAPPGDTQKRTPEADDVLGVCSLYPLASDPGVCTVPDLSSGGCCRVGGDAQGGDAEGDEPLGVALIGGVLIALCCWRRFAR